MVYIVANANCISGGPELLHQFCYHLNKLDISAEMAYYEKFSFPTQKISQELLEAYSRYECQIAKKIIDVENNTVILSEGELWFLPKFKHAKIVIWWLSVDNYYKSMKTKYAKLYAPFGMNREKYNPFSRRYLHCVQSEYAKQFLLKHDIENETIYFLSDYLSSEFIIETDKEYEVIKKDIILYNPQKGVEFTQKIIQNCSNFNFIPLIRLKHNEMVKLMMQSKVYIDFGNHPGKDRIPREAAVSGCCVITNLEGAAGNEHDVNIPKKFKIDMKDNNIPIIIERIKECLTNYYEIRKDFEDYRNEIRGQEQKFRSEVKIVSQVI